MRRWADIFGLAAVLVAVLIGALLDDVASPGAEPVAASEFATSSVRRPLPTTPTVDSPLPPPSADDPQRRMEVGPKHNVAGTAFPIAVGTWMTARHVGDGCSEISIETEPHFLAPGHDVLLHDNADLAVFQAPVNAAPIAAGGQDLRIGQDGYHLGFPKGRFAAVRSQLLGRATVNITGRFSARAPVLMWAKVERLPPQDGPLSGISGGPVFDADGRLVGVTIGEAPRRGRVSTAAPESIRELWKRAGAAPSDAGVVPPLNHTNYGAIAERLRADLIVARVICRVR